MSIPSKLTSDTLPMPVHSPVASSRWGTITSVIGSVVPLGSIINQAGKIATYTSWASNSLSHRLFELDEGARKQNIAVIESLEEGPFLLFLIPKLSLKLAKILSETPSPGQDAIHNLFKNSRDNLLAYLDSIILKGLANIILNTPDPAVRKKSLEDVFEFIASIINTEMAKDYVELLNGVPNTLSPQQLKEIAFREIAKNLFKIVFPNGENDLGLKKDTLFGIGKTISGQIWSILPTLFPAVCSPIYQFVMENRAECRKQVASLCDAEGGKAILSLQKVASSIIVAVPIGLLHHGWALDATLQTFHQTLVQFCEVDDKNEICGLGTQHAYQLIQHLVDPSIVHQHPLQTRVVAFARNRIEPIVMQVFLRITQSSAKASLIDGLLENIKAGVLKIYLQSGKELKIQYEAIAKLESDDPQRIKWVKDVFKPHSDAILQEINLHDEIARRVDSGNKEKDAKKVAEIEKQIAEMAPDAAFAIFGTIIHYEPALFSWIHPEELNAKMSAEVATFRFGKLMLAGAKFVTDTVMSATTIPKLITAEIANTIADSIVTKLFSMAPELTPESVREGKQQLQKRMAAEILRVSTHNDYKTLRSFIQNQIEAIIIEVIHKKGPHFQGPVKHIISVVQKGVWAIDLFHEDHGESMLNKFQSLPTVIDPKERQKIIDELTLDLQPIASHILQLLGVKDVERLKIIGLNKDDGLIEIQFARQLVMQFLEIAKLQHNQTQLVEIVEEHIYDVNVTNSAGHEVRQKTNDVIVCIQQISQGLIQIARNTLNPVSDEPTFAKSLAKKVIEFLKISLEPNASQQLKGDAQVQEKDEKSLIDGRDSLLDKDLQLINDIIKDFRSLGDANITANQIIWKVVEDGTTQILLNIFLNVAEGSSTPLVPSKVNIHKHHSLPQAVLRRVFGIFSTQLDSYGLNQKLEMSGNADSAKALVELLLGNGQAASSRSISSLPFMTPEYETMARGKLLEFLMDILPRIFQDMDQRKDLETAFTHLDQISKTPYLDRYFHEQHVSPFAVFHTNTTLTMHRLVPSLLQNRETMRNLVENCLLPYLPANFASQKAFTNWIIDNCEMFGSSGCAELQVLQEFISQSTGAFAIKMMSGIQRTLYRASTIATENGVHHDSSFITTQFTEAVSKSAQHITHVNEISKSLKLQAHQVPNDVMMKKLDERGILHRSLKPIVVSPEKQLEIENAIRNGPRQKEFAQSWLPERAIQNAIQSETRKFIEAEKYKQDIEHFYTPLFQNFLKASGLTANDMPILKDCRKSTFELFQKLGPALLSTMDKLAMSQGSIDGMKVALFTKLEELFKVMENAKASAPVDPEKDNAVLSPEAKEKLLKSCDELLYPALKLILDEDMASGLLNNFHSIREISSSGMASSLEMMASSNPLIAMFTQTIGAVGASMDYKPGSAVFQNVIQLGAKTSHHGFNVIINQKLASISKSISDATRNCFSYVFGTRAGNGITWFLGKIVWVLETILDLVFNKILRFGDIFQYGLKRFATSSMAALDRSMSLECNESLRRELLLSFTKNLAAEKEKQLAEDRLSPEERSEKIRTTLERSNLAKKVVSATLDLMSLINSAQRK